MTVQEVRRLILEALPGAEIEITDLAGDGDHYSARVVHASFRGKTRVEQHQLVYKALSGRVGESLHALALQTSAPDPEGDS